MKFISYITCNDFICVISFIPEKSKVCFTAYLSSDPGPYSWRTVVYDRVVTNKGFAYNTADGVFTAPRAGMYIFIWNSATDRNHNCYLFLYKNGNMIYLEAYSDARSAENDSGSMSVVLELTTGDRVWVGTAGCEYLDGDYKTSFTGCQL